MTRVFIFEFYVLACCITLNTSIEFRFSTGSCESGQRRAKPNTVDARHELNSQFIKHMMRKPEYATQGGNSKELSDHGPLYIGGHQEIRTFVMPQSNITGESFGSPTGRKFSVSRFRAPHWVWGERQTGIHAIKDNIISSQLLCGSHCNDYYKKVLPVLTTKMLILSNRMCLGFDPRTYEEIDTIGKSKLYDKGYNLDVEGESHSHTYAQHRLYNQFVPVDCFKTESEIFACEEDPLP